jgi:hypothetical protein
VLFVVFAVVAMSVLMQDLLLPAQATRPLEQVLYM